MVGIGHSDDDTHGDDTDENANRVDIWAEHFAGDDQDHQFEDGGETVKDHQADQLDTNQNQQDVGDELIKGAGQTPIHGEQAIHGLIGKCD